MKGGSKGMGMGKHRKSGNCGKSPSLRAELRREAEKDERKDNSRIKEPKQSVKELFKGG